MQNQAGQNKKGKKESVKKSKVKKKNALIVCRDRNQFWTTQKQFWQWAREGVIVKTADQPLTGTFINEDEEKLVVRANMVLNLACPNHLSEVFAQRRRVTPR